MFKHVTACIVLITSASCVMTPTPQPRRATFVQAEYDSYAGKGSGSIAGQAFLKTRAGDVKFGAAETVYLNPVTSYSTEWFERAVLAGEALEMPDERAAPYGRSCIADGSGHFRFEELPAGEYYLACFIIWEYATQFGLAKTGGTAKARVTVQENQEARAIVTLSANDLEAQRKAAAQRRSASVHSDD